MFYINLPIGLLSLVMIYLYIEDPAYLRRAPGRIDFWGLALLVVGMGAFQVLLDQGQEKDWFSSNWILMLGVIAAVGLTWFVIHELTVPDPLVDFRLLTLSHVRGRRVRRHGVGVRPLRQPGAVAVVHADAAGIPGRRRGHLERAARPGDDAVHAADGVDARPEVGPALVAAGRAADRGRSRSSSSRASTCDIGPRQLVLPQLIQGIGLALVFVPLSTIAMDPIPVQSMGYATSIFSLMRNIGSSMGISFVTTELARRTQFHHSMLAEHVTPSARMLQQELTRLGGVVGDAGAGLAFLEGTVGRQAYMMSFLDLFHVLGILFLVAAPAVWFMRRPRQAKGAAAAAH